MWPPQVIGPHTYHFVYADRQMKRLHVEFDAWQKQFTRSVSGGGAIRALQEQLSKYDEKAFPEFELEVLFGCWCAKRYETLEQSPQNIQAAAWAHLADALSPQIEAARKLGDFIDHNRLLATMVVDDAFAKTPGMKSLAEDSDTASLALRFFRNFESEILARSDLPPLTGSRR